MAKPRVQRKDPHTSIGRLPQGLAYAIAAVAVAVSALSAGSVIWWRQTVGAVFGLPDAQSQQSLPNSASDGLGPNVMTGQADLLKRLMTLLLEVDRLKGEEYRAERLEVSQRVEAELSNIEVEIALDTKTAAGKQQAGLIGLVRAALQSDRDNSSFDDWSEEGLLKAHGLATYASQSYWDEAYGERRYGESFDWYGTWEEPDLEGRTLGDLVRPLLSKESRILMMGCGNSNLSVLMYEEGFRRIVNVDISEPVIEQMRQKYEHLEGMTWRAMDASALDFDNGTFDVAMEKGLFDALYAGTGERVQAVLTETRRVLAPHGKIVSISFSADRIERLFAPDPETERVVPADAAQSTEQMERQMPPVTTQEAPLSCRIAGKLRYRKATGADQKTGSPAFHVYSCDQP